MKKFLIAAVAAGALAVAATASAALEPGIYDPGSTGCVTATYSHGVLHLAKNCASSTDAAAGADITGLTGQAFQSASFTLASASQCQGGSPRFDISTTNGLFFLGCNNVTPTTNPDGTVTYTFAPSNLIPADPTKTTPGTITAVDVLIDQQGTADVSKITVNGILEKPLTAQQTALSKCKDGKWKTSTDPKFKNQGQCVAHFMHQLNKARQDENAKHKHNK
jgi:hypothetical protein